MLDVILRAGPLEGQRVKVGRQTKQYIERIAGKPVVYRANDESDPPTGLPKFVFQGENEHELASSPPTESRNGSHQGAGVDLRFRYRE